LAETRGITRKPHAKRESDAIGNTAMRLRHRRNRSKFDRNDALLGAGRFEAWRRITRQPPIPYCLGPEATAKIAAAASAH
jgi:hypothetical protein